MEIRNTKQSRRMSLVEAKTNAVIGLLVSWIFTFYGLPLFGIEINVSQASGITICYFFLSLIRSYIIRRFFNGI